MSRQQTKGYTSVGRKPIQGAYRNAVDDPLASAWHHGAQSDKTAHRHTADRKASVLIREIQAGLKAGEVSAHSFSGAPLARNLHTHLEISRGTAIHIEHSSRN